jgi:exodeoxyribonuclease VII large subunit
MIEQTSLHNFPEFTVSEVSAALKRTVEDAFDRVRVRGEISGFKCAASGHLYMSLKDENAVMDAVCWRGTAQSLSIVPEDGLAIIATGRLTTYASRSKYQIIIDSIELAGEGSLLKLLEERRKKLAAEGLFDEARKQPIPFLSDVIGVVTSPSGAVIKDILHRLRERFPRRVLVWPVLVQGDGAAEQIAAAIEGFNGLPQDGPVPRPDLLIIARGGGSIEDLWAFNEEIVVRAVAASSIPLISAVGHETDTTLIDFSSDVRAPTPTAAAEMAVPVRSLLSDSVLDQQIRLGRAAYRLFREHRVHLGGLQRGLRNPRDVLQFATQCLDDTVERLSRGWDQRWGDARRSLDDAHRRLDRRHVERLAFESWEVLSRTVQGLLRENTRRFEEQRTRLQGLDRMLGSLSYQSVLERGFAVVRSQGVVVSRAKSVGPTILLDIEFADGHVGAVPDGKPDSINLSKPIVSSPKSSKDDKQGRLL